MRSTIVGETVVGESDRVMASSGPLVWLFRNATNSGSPAPRRYFPFYLADFQNSDLRAGSMSASSNFLSGKEAETRPNTIEPSVRSRPSFVSS